MTSRLHNVVASSLHSLFHHSATIYALCELDAVAWEDLFRQMAFLKPFKGPEKQIVAIRS